MTQDDHVAPTDPKPEPLALTRTQRVLQFLLPDWLVEWTFDFVTWVIVTIVLMTLVSLASCSAG